MTDKTLQTFVLQYYPDLDRPLQCARLAEQATEPPKDRGCFISWWRA